MILDNYILKMVSSKMRPEQSFDKETKKWISTGREEKHFEYIFVSNDEFKTKIVLESKIDFSKFEDKGVNIVLEWTYNDFQKKMGTPRLVELVPIA